MPGCRFNWIAVLGALLAFVQTGIAEVRIPVFVSIVPQKYFVQQIGRDRVNVQVMVRPGASPATYEPKPRQMAAISTTALYFAVGVPFEDAWLKNLAAFNPKMRVVHTDRGIEKIPMPAHRHEGEEHSAETGPEHGGLDPHIWLSPPLVRIQAGTILAALQDIDPSHRSDYEANYHRFVAEIDEMDAELKAMFADKQGLRFMVFHPAWGYFARAYGLKQVSVEIQGKDPKPAQLKELIERARRENIKVVFAQPQFSSRSAERVAGEIGGHIIVADPLALDWPGNLLSVAQHFKDALK